MLDTRVPRRTPNLETLAAAGAVLAWALIAASVWLGKLSLSLVAGRLIVLGVPAVAVVAALMSGRNRRWLVVFAAGSSLVAGAMLASVLVDSAMRLIIMVAAIPVAAVLVRRWPAAFLAGVVFLSGAPGLLYAYTPIQPGRLTDFALVGLWVGAIVGLLSERRAGRTITLPAAVPAVVAFGVITVVRALTSGIGTKNGLVQFRQNAWILLIVIPVAYGGWSSATIRKAAEAAVYVATFVGAWGTFRWITGPSGREQTLYVGGGKYNFTGPGAENLKAVSPQLSGHALGGWTSVALVFCVAAALGAGSKRVRFVAMGGAGFLAVSLFGSENRTGLIAALVGILVVSLLSQFSRSEYRRPSRALAVLAGLALFGLVFFPLVAANSPTKAARYADILTPSRDESFNQRFQKWSGALRDADSHPFGHGLGTAPLPAPSDYLKADVVAHAIDSTYVQVAYEEGLPAMVLFILALLFLVFALGRNGVRTSQKDQSWVAIGACAALCAFIVLIGIAQYLAPDFAEGFFVLAGLGLAPFVTIDAARRGNTGTGAEPRLPVSAGAPSSA